jgi:hypothetical protein
LCRSIASRAAIRLSKALCDRLESWPLHPVFRSLLAGDDFVGTGIWVLDPKCAVPVAIALLQSLIEVAVVRQAGEGQHTKMGMVYQYLTGPRFRTRIEAIVEKFTDKLDIFDTSRRLISNKLSVCNAARRIRLTGPAATNDYFQSLTERRLSLQG